MPGESLCAQQDATWSRSRLGDISEITAGLQKTPDRTPAKFHVPYLTVRNVLQGYLDLSKTERFEVAPAELSRFRLLRGDILIVEGNGSRDQIGRNAVFSITSGEWIHQNHIIRVRLNPGVASVGFVSGFLNSDEGRAQLVEKARTTTGLYTLSASKVASLEIPLPPLTEQDRIADVLDRQITTIGQARTAAQARLEAARGITVAFLRRAFKNITPLSIDSVRDPAPTGWRWTGLLSVARLESGHTPSRYHPEWWGGEIPWIALPDIRDLDGKVAHETKEHTNEAGLANSSARLLPAGTVVLSRTASVGFVTVMGREMATSQDFVNWVCGPDLDPSFLAFLLRVSRSYIRSLSSGAVHQTVYVPTVKAFQVCVPSITEQRRIAAELSEQLTGAERVLEATEGELAAIDALPAALVREAFRGKL